MVRDMVVPSSAYLMVGIGQRILSDLRNVPGRKTWQRIQEGGIRVEGMGGTCQTRMGKKLAG
jgi:hypothetical protein